jgi:hypothetical protein
MRLGLACAALSLLAATSVGAQAPNLAGVWKVSGKISCIGAVMIVTPTCTFRQADGRLGGECVGPNARGPISGAIAGSKVSWTWQHQATTNEGISGSTSFNGTYASPRLIRGVMSSAGLPCKGAFTQTR